MERRKWMIALAVCLGLQMALSAQAALASADLLDCLRSALVADPRMRELGWTAQEIAAQGQSWSADHGPRISVAGSPLAGITFGADGAFSAQFGLGASYSQKLPGEGTVQASLGHAMTVAGDGSSSRFNQHPSLAIGLSQPILVNGKLVDADLTEASRQLQVSLPAQRLQARQLATANAVVIELVKTWYNLGLIEASLRLQEDRIELAAKSKEILMARQNLGQASPAETLKADLDLNRLRSTRIETDWNRRQLLDRLAAMSGRRDWAGVDFGDRAPQLLIPDPAQARQEAIGMAKEVDDAEAVLAEQRANLILAGQDQVPGLGLRFSLSPKSGSPAGSADLAASFSDLGGSGASLNPGLALELNLPVWDGGRALAARELAASRVAAAIQRRDNAQEAASRRLDEILGRLDMARQKLELYAGVLVWQDQQLAIVRTQSQLGTALEIDLAQARANRDESVIEQRRAELDYLSTELELLDLCGHPLANEFGLSLGLERNN